MGKRVEAYSYISHLQTLFLKTLKGITLGILAIVLVDFLFYLGAFGMVTYAGSQIKVGYDALILPDPSVQEAITPEIASEMLSQMKSFRLSIFNIVSLTALGIIVWWSVCKGIVWCMTLKAKISALILWRFLMLNLAWLGCWMLLISTLAFAIDFTQARYFFLGLIGIFILLTSSIYAIFIPSPTWSSFKRGLFIAIKQSHYLAPPMVLLFLLYVLLSKIFTLSAHIGMQIGLLFFTLLFVAFARSFIAAAITSLHEEKQHE